MTFIEGFWITVWVFMAVGVLWTIGGIALMIQSEIRFEEIEELLTDCWEPKEPKHILIGIITGPPFHIIMIIGFIYKYFKGESDG